MSQPEYSTPLPTGTITAEEQGYRKALKPRQIQMIAIGGAIGTGLFMGAGGRMAEAGPALVVVYAICGFFAFLILRALGELVMHRPSSGSFVSYAREFYGEKMAFAAGWMYWINWAMTSIADVTAAALYMKFFQRYVPWLQGIDQWVFALAALVLVLSMNLLSVKVFGELEFWFAFIKVAALVVFLIVGVYFVLFGTPVEGHATGFSLISDNGGFFPQGVLPAFIIIQGVVFAYASIELVGTTAGETADPQRVIPRAIRTVILRIVVFYIGSVLLLALLLPYTSYRAGESPFVTFFGSIGIQGADVVMNLVVLTAALSSLNAGLYSTGRILRSMAVAGSAPRFAARINRNGVPYGGVARPPPGPPPRGGPRAAGARGGARPRGGVAPRLPAPAAADLLGGRGRERDQGGGRRDHDVEHPLVLRLVGQLRVLQVVGGVDERHARGGQLLDDPAEVLDVVGLGPEVQVEEVDLPGVAADPLGGQRDRRPPPMGRGPRVARVGQEVGARRVDHGGDVRVAGGHRGHAERPRGGRGRGHGRGAWGRRAVMPPIYPCRAPRPGRRTSGRAARFAGLAAEPGRQGLR
ncbi:amino acid permease [Rothia sp. AR01]|uniref:Amino acid permease n=1 Tax=Rothia santali TaxID=2949643 RepID=A0A9X2KMG3_9MICC|nr:amino acid permease [Rothia santali]MCP3427166.1 amino acid permease [Rothia santali]